MDLQNIDEGQLTALRRAATNGEYHLFLGAGASLGSKSQKGTPLPGSNELTNVQSDQVREIVFSLSEYAEAAVSRMTWPLAFRDLYSVRPFVIVGARLRDEPDIESVVARRHPTHEAPSLYVSPNISRGMAADLRAWNLIPIAMTAEDFASLWAEITELSPDQPPNRSDELAIRVGRQFRELQIDRPGRLPAGHDLLGGDEPRWADVVNSTHADLDWIHQGIQPCVAHESKYSAVLRNRICRREARWSKHRDVRNCAGI